MAIFKKFWERWKAFGRFLGNLLARVVLSVFYFTIFVPYGLGVRWLSDPLRLKPKPGSLWQPRSTPVQSAAEAGRQY